jgi:hypothetical protein
MNTNENIDRINDLCLTELAELYLTRCSAPAKADENVTQFYTSKTPVTDLSWQGIE